MKMEYIFPLQQSIGAASIPVVKEGDQVKRGERIASRPENALGSNLFTSVCGTVSCVDEEKICVEEANTDFQGFQKLQAVTPKELIEEAGIVGLGGAGFPTYAKLSANLGEDGVVIINAAECEPILSHNISRIEKEPENLIRALLILMEIVLVKRGIIAIKEVHTKAIEGLQKKLRQTNQKIELKKLEDIYPMGEERAIIRETLGVLLETESLPSKTGAIVVNAETAFRIREAVEERKPFIDKDMTLAGKLTENASIHILFDVPIGKPVNAVCEDEGGLGVSYGELVMGGPFTGKRTTLYSPILKTSGGIIATEEFLKGPEKIGLLVCACGANQTRLEELAVSMRSKVVDTEYCKQIHQKGTTLKCQNPGHCPGQAEKIMKLKKAGAEAVLISNCTDCTNTVMSCAPKMGLKVYHCTDGSLRAVNHPLIRRMK